MPFLVAARLPATRREPDPGNRRRTARPQPATDPCACPPQRRGAVARGTCTWACRQTVRVQLRLPEGVAGQGENRGASVGRRPPAARWPVSHPGGPDRARVHVANPPPGRRRSSTALAHTWPSPIAAGQARAGNRMGCLAWIRSRASTRSRPVRPATGFSWRASRSCAKDVPPKYGMQRARRFRAASSCTAFNGTMWVCWRRARLKCSPPSADDIFRTTGRFARRGSTARNTRPHPPRPNSASSWKSVHASPAIGNPGPARSFRDRR